MVFDRLFAGRIDRDALVLKSLTSSELHVMPGPPVLRLAALAQHRSFSSPSTAARLERTNWAGERSLRSLARDRSGQVLPTKTNNNA